MILLPVYARVESNEFAFRRPYSQKHADELDGVPMDVPGKGVADAAAIEDVKFKIFLGDQKSVYELPVMLEPKTLTKQKRQNIPKEEYIGMSSPGIDCQLNYVFVIIPVIFSLEVEEGGAGSIRGAGFESRWEWAKVGAPSKAHEMREELHVVFRGIRRNVE